MRIYVDIPDNTWDELKGNVEKLSPTQTEGLYQGSIALGLLILRKVKTVDKLSIELESLINMYK
jgi:hypothetical protein